MGLAKYISHGVVYSRSIWATSSSTRNLGLIDDEGEKLPEKRTHDAIANGFMDKGSSSIYCYECRWIAFVTGD